MITALCGSFCLAIMGCSSASSPALAEDTLAPDAPDTVVPVDPVAALLTRVIEYPGPGFGNLVAAYQRPGGDGLDLVNVGGTRGYVYHGAPDGLFAFPVSFSNRRPSAHVLADVVEGDGGEGELVTFSRGIVRTRRLPAKGVSDEAATVETETGLLCTSVAAGRLDGDDHVDLVGRCIPLASNADDWRIQVFTGRGDGRFDLSTTIPIWIGNREGVERPANAVTDFETIRAGDVNEDGPLDLVLGAQKQFSSTLLLGDGAGLFTEAEPIYSDEGFGEGLLEDVDGDTHLDLLTVSRGSLVRVRGKGDGSFEAPELVPCGFESCSRVARGDIDGDGEIDTIVGSASDDAIAVALGSSLTISVHETAAPCTQPVWLGGGRLACFGARLHVYGALGTPPTSTVCADQPSEVDCLAAGCGGMVRTTIATRDLSWPEADRVSTGCARANWDEVCVPAGATPSTVPTAYFREVGDEVVFVQPGASRDGEFTLTPQGDGWTECGAPGAPETCGCFCVQGVCPGQREVDIMESCGAPEPCPVLQRNGETFTDSACIRGALQAGQPALLRVNGYFGDPIIEDWFLVGSTGIYWSRRYDDAICGGGCESWSPVSDRCQPVAPADLDACVTRADETVDCLDPANWVKDCAPALPVCEQ